MTHFLRVLSTLSIAVPLALSLGCSGGAGGGDGSTGGGTTGTGTGSGNTSSGTTGTSSGNTSSGTTGGPFAWPGTWSSHLTYDVDCDFGFGNVKHASQDQTNTMTITDNGQGGLAADVMGFDLGGTGDATSLTLSGQYPVLDDGESPAGNVMADTNVTIAIGAVADAKHAAGTLSGMFVGEFGQKCTISKGVAALSR